MTNFKKKNTIETWHIGSGKPLKIKDFVMNLLKKNLKKIKLKKLSLRKILLIMKIMYQKQKIYGLKN